MVAPAAMAKAKAALLAAMAATAATVVARGTSASARRGRQWRTHHRTRTRLAAGSSFGSPHHSAVAPRRLRTRPVPRTQPCTLRVSLCPARQESHPRPRPPRHALANS
eukprot:5521627-Prymnesium_polylepis.1